jgi:hypothetical protein
MNQEKGTGYFLAIMGTGSFLKYKKQPVPDKAVAEKVACPRFG